MKERERELNVTIGGATLSVYRYASGALLVQVRWQQWWTGIHLPPKKADRLRSFLLDYTKSLDVPRRKRG